MRGIANFIFSVAFLFVTSLACAEELKYFSANSDIPGVTRDMKRPGFWIARHPDPDGVIMGSTAIDKFNQTLLKDKIISNLAEVPINSDGVKLKDELSTILRGLKKRSLFEESGREAGASFYKRMELEADLSRIAGSVQTRFGFLITNADERLLPTKAPLYAQAGDVDFDEVQNSALMVGEPVVVLHKSYSGQWFFVKDRIASGWVEASKVAFSTRDEFMAFLERKDIVLVTQSKADMYLDRQMTKYCATVRMGSYFVLKNSVGRSVEVLLAQRQTNGSVSFISGFLDREDVSFGFLPFTSRNIYRQAFKMLNAPYGWGDMYGEQDCSRFLQMVFATMGIHLPRNSGDQGRVGQMIKGFAEELSSEEKRVIIADYALGAQTLLRFKGHIALYLGEVGGEPYVIHETWGYRQPSSSGDRVRILNRVVVSRLDLGAGSQKGSLFDRMISARIIGTKLR
ncbi:MAG: SH3 domain-containing protein [Candidatus Omnitrophica bacterium]|nr:SH3 domain-containing protein [Candidatus Omnitrophota bacterium]